MTPVDRTLRAAYLAWLSVCVIWGTTYLGISIALETIPPALLGGLRYTAAGVLLGAFLVLRGERLPGRVHWRGLAVVAFLMIPLGNGGVIWAEQWVPSGIAAVVIATVPFWMSGVEALQPGGERPGAGTLLGMLVGFLGVVFLVWPDVAAGGPAGGHFALGLVLLQVAEIGWALGTAYGKRHAQGEHPLATSAMQMIFGGLMMLTLGTAQGEWGRLSFSARSLAAELYLVVFGSIGAYSAFQFAVRHLPMSTVSLYAYVNPIIAVILGAVVLGEPFSARIVVASVMVLAGIAITRGAGRRADA